MASALRNVVVVGGSYTGVNTAKELANALPATYRVLLIDPHSHFNHLFAFPRFSILPGHEHKAFIPYSGAFADVANKGQHTRIQARVVSLGPKQLTLDRAWQGSTQLDFDYLVAATGTRLVAPSNMPSDDKTPSVAYLRAFNSAIQRSRSVVLIGGGAVGVQMACDLKEIYPDKEVALVHSREHIMPVYHEKLSEIIKDRFKELGINFVGGSRVVLPPNGFPVGGTGEPITVELTSGRKLTAEFVVTATGQTPNTQWLTGSSSLLPASAPDSLINPANGYIRVQPTMQFADPAYPHLFAVGDIADTGAHKAARPAGPHAVVLAKNMVALIEGREPAESIEVNPAGIHLTLGLTKNIIFRNPNVKEGQTEPSFNLKEDGSADMNIEGTWVRRGVKVSRPEEYHL